MTKIFVFVLQLDNGTDQSPAEMETVKKILETVNANVTRQLLEASVQRVKNSALNASSQSASPIPLSLERPSSSERHSVNEGLAAKLVEAENPKMLHASPSPRVTPALEDMIEEVPDTDEQHAANVPAENGYVDDGDNDAASETGTDDSGLVMALDQESTDHRDENPSNSTMANANSTAKSSERTRSTISEDKAAVSHLSFVSSRDTI